MFYFYYSLLECNIGALNKIKWLLKIIWIICKTTLLAYVCEMNSVFYHVCFSTLRPLYLPNYLHARSCRALVRWRFDVSKSDDVTVYFESIACLALNWRISDEPFKCAHYIFYEWQCRRLQNRTWRTKYITMNIRNVRWLPIRPLGLLL